MFQLQGLCLSDGSPELQQSLTGKNAFLNDCKDQLKLKKDNYIKSDGALAL